VHFPLGAMQPWLRPTAVCKGPATSYIGRRNKAPPLAGFSVSARTSAMAKRPGSNPKGEFVFFDVVYEDGSQRSNRRVPAELLGGSV
jgi:hypothetical protein